MKAPLLAACAVAAAACAVNPASKEDAASLAAAETAFASHSVREDMRVAFIAAFAPDGLFVRNGWIAAARYLEARPAPPIVLDWRPQLVEVAASGELGLSTGPWRLTSKADPAAPAGYGQFVSIWRRAPAGPWKVEVDLGIAHERPILWDAPLENRGAPAGARSSGGELVDAEADFQKRATAGGLAAAFEALAAADLRFYREGHSPVLDRATAIASPAARESQQRWTLEHGAVARSGDFGYSRGTYALAPAPAKTAGYFLRVWRREAPGWRVILDVVQPAH
ncbi:MAG TPA: DUF4440 domain-containing protein [Usitatibacter sp.]|nr:DUF4440 domain-containing protein [Usitatibacter sp.]